MSCGFFERLTGYFLDDTPADGLKDPKEELHHSIAVNLDTVFNSRSHSVSKEDSPPDLPELSMGLPGNIAELTAAMYEVISKYEPRLKNISLSHSYADASIKIKEIILTANTSCASRICFSCRFDDSGKSTTQPLKKREPAW